MSIQEDLANAREALGLAQSMIRSGESMTESSRAIFAKGFGQAPVSQSPNEDTTTSMPRLTPSTSPSS